MYWGNQAIPWVLTPFNCTFFPLEFTMSVPRTDSRPHFFTGVAAREEEEVTAAKSK